MRTKLYKGVVPEDWYTLYFPIPKKMQDKEGCVAVAVTLQEVGGEVAVVGTDRLANNPYSLIRNQYGTRIPFANAPKVISELAERLEASWRGAVTKDTTDTWDRWINQIQILNKI